MRNRSALPHDLALGELPLGKVAAIAETIANVFMAHPPPAAAAVLARLEFGHLRIDLPTDLRRAIAALLPSIAQGS